MAFTGSAQRILNSLILLLMSTVLSANLAIATESNEPAWFSDASRVNVATQPEQRAVLSRQVSDLRDENAPPTAEFEDAAAQLWQQLPALQGSVAIPTGLSTVWAFSIHFDARGPPQFPAF